MRLKDPIAELFARPPAVVALLVSIALVTFAIDSRMPAGIIAATPYILAVLIAYLLPSPLAPLATSGATTVLAVIGYLLKPHHTLPAEVLLVNRSLTIATIWIVGIVLYFHRRAKDRVARMEEEIAVQRARRERDRLLTSEMAHRLKNNLNNVSALVLASIRQSASLPDAEKNVRGRLNVLMQLYEVTKENGEQSLAFGEIIARELKPFGERRFRLEGPDLTLNPIAGRPVAMIFHELRTNAMKHGALSNERGHITVSWSVEGGTVQVNWREIGGPPVGPPSRMGFGSSLVAGLVRHELGGTSELSFPPAGVGCRISIPLHNFVRTTPVIHTAA